MIRARGVFNSASSKFSTSHNPVLYKYSGVDIPQALKFDREFKYTKLPNGMVVASEFMPGKMATVSAFIKCGSRNQTKQSSGTAHFLEHLHFKGTKLRSRDNLGLQVEGLGGNLNAFTSRELTCYHMSIFHKRLGDAVDIVGDMITNAQYRNQDVQGQRSTIHRELIQTQMSMPLQSTVEIAHRGIYKNHQMGLPILGFLDNINTISRDMIVDYHDSNYVGQNIIVVGCGNLQHDQLVSKVDKHIKTKRVKPPKDTTNTAKPTFHQGLLLMESRFTTNINVGILYDAPSYFDPDFFGFLLLQKIMGDKPENELEQQIMAALPSYRLQNLMVKYPWIQKQKGIFIAYKDAGIFGNYFVIPPQRVDDLVKINKQGFEIYANNITDQQLEKAKRKVFMEVLQHQSQEEISQDIGNNLIYYDRRVCRSELAHRVNSFTKEDIQRVIKTLMEHKMQITIWGNTRKLEHKLGQATISTQ